MLYPIGIQSFSEIRNGGYVYVDKTPQIYNLTSTGKYYFLSLLNTFDANRFRMYWFGTGTPSFLVRYLKKRECNLEGISKDRISAATLTGTNYENPEPISLMYQTGYLTITGYDPEFMNYTLDYPNEEVRSGFLNLSQIIKLGVNFSSQTRTVDGWKTA